MTMNELGHKDQGAALVEMAVLLPLLLIVVLGIVDFGYALVQNLDVRHGARETSRLIAVDTYTIGAACDSMDISNGTVITLSRLSDTVGQPATVRVTSNLNTATGFFDGWLPSTLTSEVQVRMEQAPSWSTGPTPCP